MKLYHTSQETLKDYTENIDKARAGFDLSDFVNQRKEAELQGDIGHVYISGILLFNATNIDKQLGATDYKDIVEDIEEMIEQGAKAILLHINSGGGSVMGCVEAAKAIQNCPIPIVSHVEGLACSAAYKLAVGSTYIVATESSLVGNIGTIMVYTDTSALMANMGIARYAFVNDGAIYKSIGQLDGLTQEQADFLQLTINQNGKTFQDHVKANREVAEEVFSAAWYSGENAVNVGLIDEVGSKSLAITRCRELLDLEISINE